ncbi:MAG: thioredoxin domain-containing protein [Chitinivibrionales bacterium]|nr:thioredoxin domain-containing protein [Chitinivibrionales bacterium]
MPDSTSRKPNHLITETSPYLLQHAYNPVDWYGWGGEALQKAREENKPIFLSIGYAACHWCHVMEAESFENEEIASLLNECFVCIKVDREVRPDVDDVYMTAVQAMTGKGGWPLSVFLTPECRPFYGGTYFPPSDHGQIKGFKSLCRTIASIWVEQNELIRKQSEEFQAVLQTDLDESSTFGSHGVPEILSGAVESLKRLFDQRHGGFSPAPKFPQTTVLEFLMICFHRSHDGALQVMVEKTLDAMVAGGMYDHLGGGFFRYSTDEAWLVPHFEKMLYDNALLLESYSKAALLFGRQQYRQCIRETADFVLRDMQDTASNGFYSSIDADAGGKEGVFYLWSCDEIIAILGRDDGVFFAQSYGVKEEGNFTPHLSVHRGLNSLHRTTSAPREISTVRDQNQLQKTVTEDKKADTEERLKQLRNRLLKQRWMSEKPALDDKIITSWNCLTISALTYAYRILKEKKYLDAAVSAMDFITESMMEQDTLLRIYCKGHKYQSGFLDDYCFFARACLDLFQVTFDTAYLKKGYAVMHTIIERFSSPDGAAYCYSSADQQTPFLRTKPLFDSSIPSENGVMAVLLEQFSILFDNQTFHDRAFSIVTNTIAGDALTAEPRGRAQLLAALDFLHNGGVQIVIAGEPTDERTQRFVEIAYSNFQPHACIAMVGDHDHETEPLAFFNGKKIVPGSPTAYLCSNRTCQPPIRDAETLHGRLMCR